MIIDNLISQLMNKWNIKDRALLVDLVNDLIGRGYLDSEILSAEFHVIKGGVSYSIITDVGHVIEF